MAESILYQKFQQIALLNIEEHYKDKFVYAIPEWAYLTTDPEIIGAVTIHGKEGVLITKKPVDFNVDFKNIISITEYIDFLNQKMNQDLPIIGYIVFFSYVLRVKKDKDYSKKLSQYQLDEIDKFNSNNNEFTISLFILNKDLKRVNDVVELE
ncbi:hypothetical protein [Faecalibacter macacae]|uniref:Uncharacterized protein n=1 Tax=Faecalibacter macacae TaxID=1859289 RepID=A0A3L9M673_9FLAO|nr:hypothetical protein [Faecalibacter macacae]RLZ08322.1 hypothetical protein EAH69_10330 [Faecalibacter macacae]